MNGAERRLSEEWLHWLILSGFVVPAMPRSPPSTSIDKFRSKNRIAKAFEAESIYGAQLAALPSCPGSAWWVEQQRVV